MNKRRVEVKAMPGLSAYHLSWIVPRLTFERENARGQTRKTGYKKPLLRALCDRYPNIWESADGIADKAGCSVRRAQDILRELEEYDGLINDISASDRVVLRYRGSVVLAFDKEAQRLVVKAKVIRTSPKIGGTGTSVQYCIFERKLLDWYIQWALLDPGAPPEDARAARKLMADLNEAYEKHAASIEPPPAREGVRAALFAAETIEQYKSAVAVLNHAAALERRAA